MSKFIRNIVPKPEKGERIKHFLRKCVPYLILISVIFLVFLFLELKRRYKESLYHHSESAEEAADLYYSGDDRDGYHHFCEGYDQALEDLENSERTYDDGYEIGYETAYDKYCFGDSDYSYDSGYDSGYEKGYAAGYEAGKQEGYGEGYDDGLSDADSTNE